MPWRARSGGGCLACVAGLAGLACLATAAAAPPTRLPPLAVPAAATAPEAGVTAGKGPRPDAPAGVGWRIVGLPGQGVPLTRFVAEADQGETAVRIEAAGSYGHLVVDLPGQAAPARITWRWRLDVPNPAVDLARKAGDDAAAKVCLAFELPLERVPFVERQLLRMARAKTGEPLPAATLCWAWGHAEPKGALIDNPYSRRVRVIVLRNRDDATGRWFGEERDVAADWRRAFGDESAEVPPLAAVIVGADADNTGGASVAHVAGLRFAP